MAPQRGAGWRALLRQHGTEFLAWLEAEQVFDRAFELLADDLESYLVTILDDAEAGRTFVEAIPDVLARCNDDIYDEPLRAEAYAFIHLLERYRRTWRVLVELTGTANLPLARHGVRALDVGTGPAPVLFAVNDFYASLRQFAGSRGIAELCTPDPELSAIEGSRAMERFVHLFSEWARRTSGPFASEWRDFAGFDPARRRSIELAARVRTIMEEDDTSESFARQWVDLNEGFRQGAYTYRLCVFSNFLTTPEIVDHYGERLSSAFSAVTPGGVVVIAGGTSSDYANIYRQVENRALASGLRRLAARDRFDPPSPDPAGRVIKRLYGAVWQRLDVLGTSSKGPVRSLTELWDPKAPYTTKPFELRVFRRGGSDDVASRRGSSHRRLPRRRMA